MTLCATMDDLFNFDVYDEEPDAVDGEHTQAIASSKASKPKSSCRRLLKKDKLSITSKLRGVDSHEQLLAVVQILSMELHLFEFSERSELLIHLIDSSWDELILICEGLKNTFADLYLECDRGREKFSTFQVKWHKLCSQFLLAHPPSADCCLCAHVQVWLSLTSSFAKDVANPVIVSICSAVYKDMLRMVRSLSVEDDNSPTCTASEEGEDVYLRFGGGNLASMYKTRYKAMKSKCSSAKKEQISSELQVLDWIRMRDKSSLPHTLKQRDEGGMYFPDKEFLPFLKELDMRVQENTNEDMFKRYGPELASVTTNLLVCNLELRTLFNEGIHRISKDADVQTKAVDTVYKEFARKLCNTRINEFLDTQKQLMATSTGKATLSGQNLRDTLLSLHVNLKSTQ